MKKYEVREKDNILTAGNTYTRETIEAENIEAAKDKAEALQKYAGTQLGIYDEDGKPCAYYVEGEWTYTEE